MDMSKMPLFAALGRRMDWLGERQRVIAENVANADTPGYKPNDLKGMNFRDLVAGPKPRMQVASTSDRHMPGLPGHATSTWRVERDATATETAPNGNAVKLESQLLKVAETQSEHNLMTNIYRKQVGMLRKAIGARSGG